MAAVKELLTELADTSMIVRMWMHAEMPNMLNTTDETNKPWQEVVEHAREAYVFAISSLDGIVFEMRQAALVGWKVNILSALSVEYIKVK